MLETVARLTSALVSAALWPLSGLSQAWQLASISAVFGVLLVLVYGRVSFQSRLRATKRAIAAYVLESVFFRHDLRITLGAQARLLGQGFVYLGLALPPLLVMSVPCVVLLADLNLRYGVRPLRVAEAAILEATVNDGVPLESVSLAVPPHVAATPPVRDAASRTVSWRVTPDAEGEFDLVMTLGDRGTFSQPLAVGTRDRVTPLTSARWWERLLYPSDREIGTGLPLARVELAYPDRPLVLFGRSWNWLLLFFLASLASGLAGSRVFRIEV
jgi:hypothetical protein